MIELRRKEELTRWLCERIQLIPTPAMQTIGSCYPDGTIRGVVGYDHWTGPAVDMHFAGEPGFFNREYLRVIFAYPFNQLGCKVLIAQTAGANERAVSIIKRLGFKQVCVIPDANVHGDVLILTMRRHQCKWLELHHAEETAAEQRQQSTASA